jgi:hypothetical protein
MRIKALASLIAGACALGMVLGMAHGSAAEIRLARQYSMGYLSST